MDETDATEAESLTRLEAALDRIARQARPAIAPQASPDTGAVAAGLDSLIAQLRGALAAEG